LNGEKRAVVNADPSEQEWNNDKGEGDSSRC
jgi:hypothetical protein